MCRRSWTTRALELIRSTQKIVQPFIGGLILSAFLATAFVQIAWSQSTVLEAESQATYQFGQSMQFSLIVQADGGTEFDEAVLFLRLGPASAAQPIPIAFDEGPSLQVEHSIDLTTQPLAPFTTLTYWWQVEDTTGNSYSVPEQSLLYEDDRFQWQTRSQEAIHVHWAGDESALGQIALDQTADALRRVQAVVPVTIGERLDVYVYPSSADLRSALRLTGRDWIEAHARPELGVLMVSAANARTAAANLGQTIPHELSHLLLYRALGLAYDNAPRWFDEGLATLFEASPDANYEVILQERLADQDLISLSELCGDFPNEDRQSLLAYAQSAALVDFIQRDYGNSALSRMVSVLGDGADCQTFVERGIGISVDELERSWLSQYAPASLAGVWQRGGVWLVVVVAGFALMAYFIVDSPFSRYVKKEE